jgi:hypothetical protein
MKEIVDGFVATKPEGAKLPDTLYLQVDRGSDMFNKQWLGVLAWWLEEKRLFKKIVLSALPVGHSHDVRVVQKHLPTPYVGMSVLLLLLLLLLLLRRSTSAQSLNFGWLFRFIVREPSQDYDRLGAAFVRFMMTEEVGGALTPSDLLEKLNRMKNSTGVQLSDAYDFKTWVEPCISSNLKGHRTALKWVLELDSYGHAIGSFSGDCCDDAKVGLHALSHSTCVSSSI